MSGLDQDTPPSNRPTRSITANKDEVGEQHLNLVRWCAVAMRDFRNDLSVAYAGSQTLAKSCFCGTLILTETAVRADERRPLIRFWRVFLEGLFV